MAAPKKILAARERTLAHALSLPEAWEDRPWDQDPVAKVRKKIFVFFGTEDGEGFGMAVKLPESGAFVLGEDWAMPTAYGLGRHGWVSVRFRFAKDLPSLSQLCEWIDESYGAIAPKTLARQVLGGS